LLYEETASDRFGDLWFLERSGDGSTWKPKLYLQTGNGERLARLSPDGRFVAYLSNETGQEEVYVRPFPRGERKWTVSRGGAFPPLWRSDGRELLYVSQGAVMAVPVSTDPDFSMGSPAKLFPHAGGFDVTSDGQRFLLAPPEEDALQPTIRVVQNWYAEFRDRQ
jgi:serine/threonine-protein kinase